MVHTGIDYAEANRRELEEWDRRLAERAAATQKRRPPGTTIVYSVRLESELVTTLETISAELGLLPSQLVRRFVRQGVSRHGPADALAVLDQLDIDLERLRALVTG